MVSFILDAILIIICIAVIATSIKRGFVRTILSIISSVASILLAVVFTPTVSNFFYDKFMLSAITSGISDTVRSLAGNGNSEGITQMFDTMPEALSDILSRYNVSDKTVSDMAESAQNGLIDIDTVCETIASPIATTISNVLAFVICFIVALIVLKIVIAIVDTVFKLPILNSVNKGAGLILGLALAVVIIFVYSEAAVHLVNSLGALSPDIFGEKVIEDTVIVKFFSYNNIFGLIENVIQGNISIEE